MINKTLILKVHILLSKHFTCLTIAGIQRLYIKQSIIVLNLKNLITAINKGSYRIQYFIISLHYLTYGMHK